MEIQSQVIVALTLYKVLSLGTGSGFSYMGYRLFMEGVRGNAGTITGSSGNKNFAVRNAAPGTFFALFGALIVGFTIYNRLEFEIPPATETPLSPPYENTPPLPDKPPI